jgi:hypothetical protein
VKHEDMKQEEAAVGLFCAGAMRWRVWAGLGGLWRVWAGETGWHMASFFRLELMGRFGTVWNGLAGFGG